MVWSSTVRAAALSDIAIHVNVCWGIFEIINVEFAVVIPLLFTVPINVWLIGMILMHVWCPPYIVHKGPSSIGFLVPCPEVAIRVLDVMKPTEHQWKMLAFVVLRIIFLPCSWSMPTPLFWLLPSIRMGVDGPFLPLIFPSIDWCCECWHLYRHLVFVLVTWTT